MNVIYDSRNYCISEFPGRGGIELVDKLSCRSTYLEGDMEQCFRNSLASVITEDPSDESLDDFISGYGALMTQPVLLQ